jgi:hypothetical protein
MPTMEPTCLGPVNSDQTGPRAQCMAARWHKPSVAVAAWPARPSAWRPSQTAPSRPGFIPVTRPDQPSTRPASLLGRAGGAAWEHARRRSRLRWHASWHDRQQLDTAREPRRSSQRGSMGRRAPSGQGTIGDGTTGWRDDERRWR